MKIAIINEFSAKEKNKDILAALQDVKAEVYNVGMKNGQNDTELTYIHTGLMAGALINSGAVDFVIGGCGTGQGFAISAMQYPGVYCGLILHPLDAWLFSQINGGNCISLALNYGYGWAADFNLKYIFEKLFKDEAGGGYPPERKESQKQSRERLATISTLSHKSFTEILEGMDSEVLAPVLASKPFCDLITAAPDKAIAQWFADKLKNKNN